MTFIIKDNFLICTENGIELSPTFVFSLLIALILFVTFVIIFITKNRAIKNSEPFFIPIGRSGVISEQLSTHYQGSPLFQIKVAGEIWQARSANNEILDINDEVDIVSQEKNLLILNVKKRGRS